MLLSDCYLNRNVIYYYKICLHYVNMKGKKVIYYETF